jgi:hypothetical protein
LAEDVKTTKERYNHTLLNNYSRLINMPIVWHVESTVLLFVCCLRGLPSCLEGANPCSSVIGTAPPANRTTDTCPCATTASRYPNLKNSAAAMVVPVAAAVVVSVPAVVAVQLLLL